MSPIGQGAYGVVVAARVKNINSLPNVFDEEKDPNAMEDERNTHDSGDD